MSMDAYKTGIDGKMKTPELTEKLHDYYRNKQGWAFITQLRNTTGYSSQIRTADAMAMGLWPSSGLKLIGFELKVSRSDWLHELKDPTKSEEMKQFCDEWYLVIPDVNIIKNGELPDDWGLMTASGRGRALKVKRPAPTLNPVDVDRAFLASVFRNLTEKNMPLDRHTHILNQQLEFQKQQIERDNKRTIEEAAEHERKIKEFETATGIDFTTWGRDHMELAKVVKSALGGKYDNTVERMKRLRQTSENITKFIDDEIQEYQI